MAFYLKNGASWRVTTRESMDLHEALPAGNYVIKKDAFNNFYLETVDSFEIHGKLYGTIARHTDRILRTFLDRPASTGIMLAGEKGSGKTLLAKNISLQAAAQGIPTIIINAAWCGDEFNAFMQQIDQPTVILFDEFEKVYDQDDQQAILTLLDGVFPSKKLFVLTCNDKWRIDTHMRNRPGRIYYMLDFKGLDHDFIVEYCADNLKRKDYTEQICKIAMMFDQFNFDMLKALVEEMNRYGETPQECLAILNAKPEFADSANYKIHLQVGGIDIGEEGLESSEWNGNPLNSTIWVDYQEPTVDKDEEGNWARIRFTGSDLRQIDANEGKFVFVNADGCRIVLRKVREPIPKYWDAF